MKKIDVIVLGTGTAGQTAAFDLAAEGYDVDIIESSSKPGGVCALRSCQAKTDKVSVTRLHENNIMSPYPSCENDIV